MLGEKRDRSNKLLTSYGKYLESSQSPNLAVIDPKEKFRQFQEFFRLFKVAKHDPEKFTFYLDSHVVQLVTTHETISEGGVEKTRLVDNIGKGGCKKAICFGETACLIPNCVSSLDKWERMIKEEKQASDEIAEKTSIRTQDFKITTLSVRDPDTNALYSIDVLAAKNFYHLAAEEKILIIDRKNNIGYGEEPCFYDKNNENLRDPNWSKQLLQTLVNEIVLAASYGLDIWCTDKLNYYLSHPIDSNTPPTAHLFLYDFASKASNLTFPILKGPFCPKKEYVLKVLKTALEDIFFFAPNSEVASFGFEEVDKKVFFYSQFATDQAKSILENKQLIDEMLDVAFSQVPLMVPSDSSKDDREYNPEEKRDGSLKKLRLGKNP